MSVPNSPRERNKTPHEAVMFVHEEIGVTKNLALQREAYKWKLKYLALKKDYFWMQVGWIACVCFVIGLRHFGY